MVSSREIISFATKRKGRDVGIRKFVAPDLTVGRSGRILLGLLDQVIARALQRRRSARHAARRRQRLLRIVAWAGAVLIGAAFLGGFVWRSGWWRQLQPQQSPVAVTADERAEAYRLLDEAVCARHEERAQGAMNAIAKARRLDPDLPGIDFFVGEMAWESRDAQTVRRAARESLRRAHNEAGSKLLLALVKWSTRNADDAATVGNSVREMLSEVADESVSDPAAFFFHGELSRFLGDGTAAHRQLLGALHRQAPWTSATLIATKLQFAAAEALRTGHPATVPPPDDAAQAALELLRAPDDTLAAHGVVNDVIVSAPLLHVMFLLQDIALTHWSGNDGFGAVDRSRCAETAPYGVLP